MEVEVAFRDGNSQRLKAYALPKLKVLEKRQCGKDPAAIKQVEPSILTGIDYCSTFYNSVK